MTNINPNHRNGPNWDPDHLKTLPFQTPSGLQESLFERVNQAIHDKSMRLLDNCEIASAIASSGASMFDLYDVEFDADDVTITEEGIWVDFSFNISGEPDDDCRPCTDGFSGKATVAIDPQGHVSFQDVTLD